MDVAVIGRGTASIITTLNLVKRGHKVTIFYDPNIPHINVGESTTGPLGDLIWSTLGITIHDLVDRGICSYKMGIQFDKWGVGKKFNHNFLDNRIAFHFETKEFNKFIHEYLEEKKLVEYIPQRVDSALIENDKININGYEFDFMVNCAGWSKEEDYYEPIFETVNSAVLFKKEYEQYEKSHTLHLATEDGWQFGLPFPKENIFKCGYLYNDKYITKEKVLNKLPKDAVVYENYSWKPKYCKKLIENYFIANNGNRLFFFEPLQAQTLHYTNDISKLICDYLDNRNQYEYDRINHLYLDNMYSQQLCLAFHYQFGSIYNSDFWEDVVNRAKNLMSHSPMGRGERFVEAMEYDMKYKNEVSKVAWMIVEDHIYITNGMIGKEWVGLGKHSLPSFEELNYD